MGFSDYYLYLLPLECLEAVPEGVFSSITSKMLLDLIGDCF